MIAGEKGELEKALKQLEEADKTRAAELEKTREEVTRLRSDVEKVKDEHQAQTKHVTDSATTEIANAKTEFEDKEKLLLAEIESLKRENQSLKDTEKLQREQVETMAKKMENWRALSQKLNEKMEG